MIIDNPLAIHLDKTFSYGRKCFDENDVNQEIVNFDRSLISEDILWAENLVFALTESNNEEYSVWGTFFGPLLIYENGNTFPPLETINPDYIPYWEERAKQTPNPVLKARYFGLVWDFRKKFGLKQNFETGKHYIQSLILAADGEYFKYIDFSYHKFKRALQLALSFGKKEKLLVDEIINKIISFGERLSENDRTWGRSFDILFDKKGIELSEEQETILIDSLYGQLDRLEREEKIDPGNIEYIATRIALYLRKKGKSTVEVIERILTAYDKTMPIDSAMRREYWLGRELKLCKQFGLLDKIDRLQIRIRKNGKDIPGEMTSYSFTGTLPADKVKANVDFLTEGEPEEIIRKLIVNFIPSEIVAKEQAMKSKQENTLFTIIPKRTYDKEGRIISVKGGIDADMDTHIIEQIIHNIKFSNLFLSLALDRLIETQVFSSEVILDYLNKSPLFDPVKFPIIRRGLDAFFESDYITFIHVIIPQIECALRKAVEISGENIYKPNKESGFNYITFGDILNCNSVADILDGRLKKYFKVLFTDSKGLNLRNDVCHGIASEELFNKNISIRVLHALLCLGAIRIKENDD